MSNNSMPPTISFLLGYICKANHNAAENVLADVGLYAGQEQFLSCLWTEDGQTQVELAHKMYIRPPTVNKMLSRLESTGLVERRLDPEDNRFTRVYLTDAGHHLKQEVEQAFAKLEARVIAHLSVEEQILLKRLLMQVHENLKDS